MNGRRSVITVSLLVLSAGALVVHSLQFNFVTDDAFISFVYARNLARHGQLVFNLGERVEGYTNFLWTLILAGFLKLSLPPEVVSRVLGTVCAVATMFVCAFASRRLRYLGELQASSDAPVAPSWSPWDAVPGLLLAGVSGYACWSSGGLETQLFTLLVTLGATMYVHERPGARRPPGSAVAFGLAALTRPEGILFFGVTVLHSCACRWRAGKPLVTRDQWVWLGAWLALVVPHLLWRRWYYGWWFPNTFYVKAGGGFQTWGQGVYYVFRWMQQLDVWPASVIVAVVSIRHRDVALRSFIGYAGVSTAVFLTYVISVGGDFMGLFRFANPVLPALAIATASSLRLLTSHLSRLAVVGAMTLVLVAQAAHQTQVRRAALTLQSDRGIDSPGYLREYTANRAAIGKFFRSYAAPGDFAAVGGAGAQVYYSEIPSLDCYGLNDAYVAHHVPRSSIRPGHQKYAPLQYQLARHPTIITSNYYRIGSTSFVPSAQDAETWRVRGYRYVNVQVDGLGAPWYTFLERIDRGH